MTEREPLFPARINDLAFLPVGECCGRKFWTWGGWLWHQDKHHRRRA